MLDHGIHAMQAPLSIIIPTLNAAPALPATAAALMEGVEAGLVRHLVLSDGGSTDWTARIAQELGALWEPGPKGRGGQLARGAARTGAPWLLFLHADTRLPEGALQAIERGLRERGLLWGRFDVRIAGRAWMLSLVARMMNARSRLTGIATGDQAVFVMRSAFEAAGGFPDQPLMEDIELSKRLRAHSRPLCLRAAVTTSGRRWDENGALRTVLLMWWLRWRYWRGTPAGELAQAYR